MLRRCDGRAAASSDGSSRIQLNVSAGRGFDVADVSLDGLPDLGLPVGCRVDRVADLLAEFLDAGVQQLVETLLLAGELVVERALGGTGVPDDVGDGAGAVSAFVDRRRETVEQPLPERIDVGGLCAQLRRLSVEVASSATVVATSPPLASTLASIWYQTVPYRTGSWYGAVPRGDVGSAPP